MTPIAEALKPYTLYLIYAQIFLLSLAIFVGALLIIRRLWRREAVDGGQINDRDKLAAEIHEEMLRLQDLRNRLDPSFVMQGKDISAAPIARVLQSAAGDGSAQGALDQIDVENKIQQATSDLNKEIADLTHRLNKAEEELTIAAVALAAAQSNAKADSGSSSSSSANASNEGGLGTMSESEERTLNELHTLKEKLEDYQAFEDDIALVKQYKAEIERLKAQIASMQEGGSLGVSEDDIADLFAEMGAPNEEPMIFKADPAESRDESELRFKSGPKSDPNSDELEKMLAQEMASEREMLDQEASPAKGYVAEPKLQEPGLPSPTEENAEALAELGEEDPFMAEFEKVLNTKDQEKNS